MKHPSIDIGCVDDAVDHFLMPQISNLQPDCINEEDEARAESLRTELRVAIKQVLADHKVKIIDRWTDAVRECMDLSSDKSAPRGREVELRNPDVGQAAKSRRRA